MPHVVYLLVAVATAAGTVSRLIECWIRSRHQVEVTRECDRTLLSAIRQLHPEYDLEYQAPNGSKWLISPNQGDQIAPERW